MNKTILTLLSCAAAFLMFAATPSLEAKHHRHTRVQIGMGNVYQPSHHTVVRRYVAPVAVPVYPVSPYYVVGHPAPGYVYAVPAYPTYPGYVEEVHTVRQQPVGFAGLSFSWNFFK